MASRLEVNTELHQDQPIDPFALLAILWQQRLLIVAITSAFAIGSVFYAVAQTDIFLSEALLVPAEASQPANPLLAQLGAAAGLVGISGSNNQSNQVTTALATLQSREFLRQFIARHNLLPALVAGSWDAGQNRSLIDPSVYDVENATWVSDAPSEQEGVRIFSGILSVDQNPTSGLVSIAIEWLDPVLARDWVTWLVQDVNDLIKEQDLREATSAIEYLQTQLQTTQLVEMQRAFYQLIESQTRIVMLADVRDDYVFRTVDPAYVPEKKIRPRRSTISIVGTILGVVSSVVLVLLLQAVQTRRKQVAAS